MRMTAPTAAYADDIRPRGYDRVGLAVAVALHLGLAAMLVWSDKEAPATPTPDRITVIVSDEIALTSTSPDPSADPAASIAPELGDPAPPVAEPRPALVPTPAKKPTSVKTVTRPVPAKPQPAPRQPARSAPAKPQPAEATPAKSTPAKAASQPAAKPAPARGSRLGSDFLEGAGGKGRDADQPAARAGPLTASALSSAISRQLRPHWTAPQGVDADKLVTILTWQMNPDGSLRGRPQVVDQLGVTDSNEAQKDRHAELAIRAVQLAAPFDLPEEYYAQWKNVRSFRFDRKL